MRRAVAPLAAALVLLASGAEAQDKIKVGVLKLSSSAVLFVGVEKGFVLPSREIVDTSFLEAAAKAVGD